MTKRAYISQILLLLSSFASMSQSSNKNYVMTLSPLSASVPWSLAVFDKDGNIEQATDYLVTGIPVTRGSGASVDDRLHTGKPFYGVNGLALYDNNARFYSPIDGRFTSIDPLCEKYPDISPYVHCNNNPLSIIDPTGEIVIFINGYAHIEDEAGNSSYWADIDAAIMEYLGDNNAKYYDGSCGFGITSYIYDNTIVGAFIPSETGKYINSNNRAEEGYSIGMRDAAEIFSSIRDENGNITETIKIITHSMGAAFGKGFVSALTEYMKENDISMDAISFEADFAPFQPNKQTAVEGVTTLQFSHSDDIIAGDKQIKGAKLTRSDTGLGRFESHRIVSFKPWIKMLPNK